MIVERYNPDAYLPLAQVADRAGVETTTVKFWRRRGWINARGERQYLRVKPAGQNFRYRLGDVLQAEVDTSANPNSRRPAELAAQAA